MMYEMRRGKPKARLLPTQMGKWIAAQVNVKAVTGIRTPVPRFTYSAL